MKALGSDSTSTDDRSFLTAIWNPGNPLQAHRAMLREWARRGEAILINPKSPIWPESTSAVGDEATAKVRGKAGHEGVIVGAVDDLSRIDRTAES